MSSGRPPKKVSAPHSPLNIGWGKRGRVDGAFERNCGVGLAPGWRTGVRGVLQGAWKRRRVVRSPFPPCPLALRPPWPTPVLRLGPAQMRELADLATSFLPARISLALAVSVRKPRPSLSSLARLKWTLAWGRRRRPRGRGAISGATGAFLRSPLSFPAFPFPGGF